MLWGKDTFTDSGECSGPGQSWNDGAKLEEGAGITGIIMNRTTVDLFNPKTIRSTMGSIYRLPYYITDNLEETLAMLQERVCICMPRT